MNQLPRITILLLVLIMIFSFSACGTTPPEEESSGNPEPSQTEEAVAMDLVMMIDGTEVSVEWESNEAVNALRDLVSEGPLTVKMSMYGGFEQVGSLGAGLPRNDVQTTTEPGDIVLYSGNQIVVFYGSNSWAYTRLGHITDKNEQELTELLGNGNVEITIQERLFLNED